MKYESVIEKMKPFQILFNRRMNREILTEEENKLLDGDFPVVKAQNNLYSVLTFHDIKDILPPFGKIVELENNGFIFKASLFDYIRPEGYVRWLVDNPDKIEFSTATKWRFIS